MAKSARLVLAEDPNLVSMSDDVSQTPVTADLGGSDALYWTFQTTHTQGHSYNF